MRWWPEEDTCAECGFDWTAPGEAVIADVASGPDCARAALQGVADVDLRRGDRWSAAMYLWHLADVVRIGTERLMTLALDPAAGVPCWDENALAEARRYPQLSAVVGEAVLARAVEEWLRAAESVDVDAEVDHPLLGTLSGLDVMRRNAHEVRHHVLDIARS